MHRLIMKRCHRNHRIHQGAELIRIARRELRRDDVRTGHRNAGRIGDSQLGLQHYQTLYVLLENRQVKLDESGQWK